MASTRRAGDAGAMRGVTRSGDAAGSIDMTGLLSAERTGSVTGPFRGRRSRGDDHDQRIRPGLLIPDIASRGGILVPRDATRTSQCRPAARP
jgi:hypothetical protein